MAERAAFFAEARGALAGLIRFAAFDKSGAQYFSNDPAACARSFWTCALAAPFFLIGIGTDLADPKLHDPIAHVLAGLDGFVIGCVGTPLFAWLLLTWLGRMDRWPIAVFGYNWLSLLLNVPMTLCLVLKMLGLIDDSVASVLIIAYYVFLSFMFSVLLDCGVAAPVALTLFDLVLTFGIDLVGQNIGF